MRSALISFVRARIVLMMSRHRRRVPHARISHSRRWDRIAHVLLLLLGCVVSIDVHHLAFIVPRTHMLRWAEMMRIVLWMMRVLHVSLLMHWWCHGRCEGVATGLWVC